MPEAMAVVDEMRGLFGGEPEAPIFPGMKGKPMSDATLAKALRTTGGTRTGSAATEVRGRRSSGRGTEDDGAHLSKSVLAAFRFRS